MTAPFTNSNNAVTTVAYGAGGIGTNFLSGDTTMTVAAGTGALFPASGSFMILLGTLTGTWELCLVGSRSVDTFSSITRGVNLPAPDTTASVQWNIGSTVQQTASAGVLAQIGRQFTQDAIGGGISYVLSGLVASKDATTASQLDVTAGIADCLQTDGTLARYVLASTTFTTSVASTTYFLDLNPNGTYSFATSHSGTANYQTIATVTTDGSHNILAITDTRQLVVQLFPNEASSNGPTLGGVGLVGPARVIVQANATLRGTVNGGVTLNQAGPIRNSYDTAALFDGSTGYVSMPTTGLPTSGSMSLEAWIRIASNPSGGAVPFSIGNNTANQSFYISMNSSGQVQVSNNNVATGNSSALSTNVWHHVVATYDGTSMRCYVDGSLTGGPTAATVTPTYGTASIGVFGGPPASAFFPGSIAQAAVYNTALSSVRILAHYNAGISQTASSYPATVLADSPVRYYKLNELQNGAYAGYVVCYVTPSVSRPFMGPDGTQFLVTTPNLIPAFQETGVWGMVRASPPNSSDGYALNFKTNMSNVPSSLTFSTIAGAPADANVGSGPLLDFVTIFGFAAYVNWSVASTFSRVYRQYTTVGNCLLAVNTLAHTFDHHCEICGHVSLAVPFASLNSGITPMSGGPHMSYTCPVCAAIECFNCNLTNADAVSPLPQGMGPYATTRGAVATLIRQMQSALALPLNTSVPPVQVLPPPPGPA